MIFAYRILLMTVKQHTKFQVIPISSFRVVADENFSNDTKFKSGKQEVDMRHPRLSHDTTHSAEAAYQISNHSYKWLLRNM